MSRRVASGSVLVLLVVAVACGSDVVAPGPGPDLALQTEQLAPLGDSVTLEVGQTAIFDDRGVAVTFVRLVEDSRCPIGVTCVWEGDAAVLVRVDTDAESTEEVLHTTLDPRTATIGAFVIELLEVLPHPVDGVLTDPARTRIVIRLSEVAVAAVIQEG